MELVEMKNINEMKVMLGEINCKLSSEEKTQTV